MPGPFGSVALGESARSVGKGGRREDQVRVEDQGKLEKLQEWESMVSPGFRPPCENNPAI